MSGHTDTIFPHIFFYVLPSNLIRGAATYETATIRQFYHGRTETLRVCTQEVVDMCRVMLDSLASVSQ